MSASAPDLDPEEWLLRRLPPYQPLQPLIDGRVRPSSAAFSPSSAGGGISFNREATLRQHGRPLWEGCPEETWAVAAIKVRDLVGLGLEVRLTPPPPHHAEAFGIAAKGPAQEKRIRKRIAEIARIAVWPGRIETWPPTDIAPPTVQPRLVAQNTSAPRPMIP